MTSHSLPILAGRKAMSLLAMCKLQYSKRLHRFAGRLVLAEGEANHEIAERIRAGCPFMVCRLGSSELAVWVNASGVAAHRGQSAFRRVWSALLGDPSTWAQDVVHAICNNAGFFPPDPALVERYAELLGESLSVADIVAVWFSRHEDRILNRHAEHSLLMTLKGLEPYLHHNPWTLALTGRRVLIVHPFAKTIRRQFDRRSLLFGDFEILPDFELLTLPAVQSIGGAHSSFRNWFEALERMQNEVSATEFDVAIIGAGAYGLPLAAFIKRQGRQAIHLGGSTQLLFGIKGRRWDDRPEVNRFYNDLWVRPLPEETPTHYKSVEQGCYW